MIEFRKIPSDDRPEPSAAETRSNPISPSPMLFPVDLPRAQQTLFDFIRSLLADSPHATWPLLVTSQTLTELYEQPAPPLIEALRRRLDSCLLQFGPNSGVWGELELSPAVWGLALAAHNCVVSFSGGLPPEPLPAFMAALLDSLHPARSLADMLTCHALLNPLAAGLADMAQPQVGWLQRLVALSPLTAVCHPHRHTPPPLVPLGAELLLHWRRRKAGLAPWRDPDDWLQTVELLIDQPQMAHFLRRHWLALPHHHRGARNLGLLLEGLRRRGNHRAFILHYYEAYEYHRAETALNEWNEPQRVWPLLLEIERLLRAGHDLDAGHETAQEAALRLNRRGNELFLKFYPLTRIIDEDGPPDDYRHLRDLPLLLRPLRAAATVGPHKGLNTGTVQFESEQ